jgi:hypothetical protein
MTPCAAKAALIPASLLLIVALVPPALSQDSVAATDQSGWRWFQECSENREMGIEVLLKGKLIHSSSFPICPSDRSKNAASQQKVVVFHFKGGHVFQGEYRTAPTEVIEGNIWQAGVDSDAILLGISFMTKKQVLLNTIHVGKVGRLSTSKVDRDIVVRTFPVRRN